MVAQWLRLNTPNVGGPDSVLGQGARSCMLQVKKERRKKEGVGKHRIWSQQCKKVFAPLIRARLCPTGVAVLEALPALPKLDETRKQVYWEGRRSEVGLRCHLASPSPALSFVK